METIVPGMTIAGWIFFIFAWGFILSLTIFCFARLLGTRTSYTNSDVSSKEAQ